MESLIHADIFFFVTTIAVVLVTIVFVVALVYLIRVLRDASAITRRVREESEAIGRDIEDFRAVVKAEGFKFRHLLSFFFNLTGKRESRRLRKKKKNEEDSS